MAAKLDSIAAHCHPAVAQQDRNGVLVNVQLKKKFGFSSSLAIAILTLFVTGTALAYTAAAAGPTPSGVGTSYLVAGSGSLVFTGKAVNAFTGVTMQGVNINVAGASPIGRSNTNGNFEGRAASASASLSVGGITGYVYTTIPMPKDGINFGKVPVFASQFITEIYAARGLAPSYNSNYQGGALVVDSTGAPISGAIVEASTVTGSYIFALDNNWGSIPLLAIDTGGFASPAVSGVTGNTGLALNIGPYVYSNKSYVMRARRTAGGAFCTSATRAPTYPAGYPAEASAIIQRLPGAVNIAVFVCN